MHARLHVAAISAALLLAAGMLWAAPKEVPDDGVLTAGLLKDIERPRIAGRLSDVINRISTLSGVTVVVDWEGLAKFDIGPNDRVALRLSRATPAKLLTLALTQASNRRAKLAWRIHRGSAYVVAQPRRSSRAARGSGKGHNFEFDEVQLVNVLEFFRTLAGVNFHVNWRSLQAVGIDKTTPVTLKAQGISVGRAMDLIFASLSGNADKFSRVYWVVDKGIVNIATGTALDQTMRTRAYDVTDLLMIVPNFRAPRMQTRQPGDGTGTRSSSSNSNASSGPGPSIFDEKQDENRKEGQDERRETKQQRRQSLVNMIKSMIGPEMWRPTGKGSIRIFRGQMIITQSLLGFKLLDSSASR